MLTRRKFLTTLALAAAVISTPGVCLAGLSPYGSDADGTPLPPLNDRDLRGRPAQQPLYVDGILNLRSGYTGERFQFHYRDAHGNYNPEMLHYLNWFMRCSHDNQFIPIDTRVIEMLNYIAKWFPGNPEITINSAYRTPSFNRILAKGNENVAKNSLHIAGKALDFSIPGIPIRQVCQVAQTVRNMAGYGGLGYYPHKNFVHLDCGDRASTWVK